MSGLLIFGSFFFKWDFLIQKCDQSLYFGLILFFSPSHHSKIPIIT